MSTTMTDLPLDLVREILFRVPLTSLRSVRSTCKQWNALSKDEILCNGAQASHQFMGFMAKDYRLCSMRFNLNEDGEESIKDLDNSLNKVKISKVSHCDGLLLCVTRDGSQLVVWNPYLGQTKWIKPRHCTGQTKWIKPRHCLYDRYAMGYDKSSNNRNYKILRVWYRLYLKNVFGYDVYDFSSDSWRVLDISRYLNIKDDQRSVSLKGNTFFFAKDSVGRDFLLCFDFTKERFGQFLSLPFEHYSKDHGSLSSLKDEKFAALHPNRDTLKMEIWVTTKIEPNVVSWISFLKLDMNPPVISRFLNRYRVRSFFIDEEKKLALVLDFDGSQFTKNRNKNTAYIVGENGYLTEVNLGEAVNHCKVKKPGFCVPLVCSCAYVPSLVQINQTAPGKRKVKKRKRTTSSS